MGTYYFKTIFDNHYNKYEESFDEPEVLNEVPVTPEDDMF